MNESENPLHFKLKQRLLNRSTKHKLSTKHKQKPKTRRRVKNSDELNHVVNMAIGYKKSQARKKIENNQNLYNKETNSLREQLRRQISLNRKSKPLTHIQKYWNDLLQPLTNTEQERERWNNLTTQYKKDKRSELSFPVKSKTRGINV